MSEIEVTRGPRRAEHLETAVYAEIVSGRAPIVIGSRYPLQVRPPTTPRASGFTLLSRTHKLLVYNLIEKFCRRVSAEYNNYDTHMFMDFFIFHQPPIRSIKTKSPTPHFPPHMYS